MKKVLLAILLILLLLVPIYFSEDSTTTNTTTPTLDPVLYEKLYSVVDCKLSIIDDVKKIECLNRDNKILSPVFDRELEVYLCRSMRVSPIGEHTLCVEPRGYLFFKKEIKEAILIYSTTLNTTLPINSTSTTYPDVNDDSKLDSNVNDDSTINDSNIGSTNDINQDSNYYPNRIDSNLGGSVIDRNYVDINYPTRVSETFAENGCIKRYQDGKYILICKDQNGEKTAITKTDFNTIATCKIIVVDGLQKKICQTTNNEIVETKTEIKDVNEIRKCSSIVSSDGNKSILCENKDGELVTPTKENLPTNVEILDDRIKYNVSNEEKKVTFDKNTQSAIVEQNRIKLTRNLSEEKIDNFDKAAEEKKFTIKRELKVEKTVSDKEEFKSSFTSRIKNESNEILTSVSIIEVIPKEVALSAFDIKSEFEFIIIDDDPVIEFIIPSLGPGEEADVIYFVEKQVDVNAIDNIGSAISFSAALSQEDCVINTANSKSFDLFFDVQGDFTSLIDLSITIPYQEACVEFQKIPKETYLDINCNDPILFAQDALFEGIGLFTYGERSCSASFANGELNLNFKTKTDMLVHPLLGGSSEITFHEWNMVETTATSSLTIKLPDGVVLNSFYPRSDPKGEVDIEKRQVVWSPIPSADKMPSIKYSALEDNSAANELTQTAIYIIIIIITLIAIVIVAGAMFIKNSKKNAKRNELKLIVKKMKQMEHDYLLGKIDETTYRRLMEQYHMQRNDLEVELFSQKPKQVTPPKSNN
ncbi:MAG: hypothetical protein WC915_00055 [archaeon]|jgi:hypothetical protein